MSPAQFWSAPDGPVQGVAAIRKRYFHSLTMHPTIELQTLSVNLVGDIAMLRGRWIVLDMGFN
jgi:hypothetical protein